MQNVDSNCGLIYRTLSLFQLNVGGSMDANVVYSQDSYVPQQVSANLTLDLLDNSFNFLDFGGEFSGIESIIENYFGEGGYFANEDVLKLLQNLRPKRNIIHDDKIQEFQKMYDESKDKRKLELEDDATQEEEAKTAFYVRMFGNEILYIDNFLQYRHNPTQLLYLLTQELSSQKMFKVRNSNCDCCVMYRRLTSSLSSVIVNVTYHDYNKKRCYKYQANIMSHI